MKKFITSICIVGMLFGMQGCLQMPTKIERAPSRAASGVYNNPSKHHPYPPRAKNRSNQKHWCE